MGSYWRRGSAVSRSRTAEIRGQLISAAQQQSLFSKIWPELLAFALGLGLTWWQSWRIADLVWCLWLSSLVLGYLTILSTIVGGVLLGMKVVAHEAFPAKHRNTAIAVGVGIALFTLVFFSFHFCGFHSGHAGFLAHFFPVGMLPKNAFMHAFMNPLLLWQTTFQYLMPIYGYFLVPTIIAERKNIFAAIYKAKAAVHTGMDKQALRQFIQPSNRKAIAEPFMRPYINVIRMHLLIFFFAFCHALKIESFWVFVVVYGVYFFPWKVCREYTRALNKPL